MPPRPSDEEIEKWDRWFAVEMNGIAWDLTEKPNLSPAEKEQMLHAAHASALHWGRVGNELNRVRADLLLGQVYALLRNGPSALLHARRNWDYVTTHESADWEIAFAHAVLAHAALAANDQAVYQKHYAEAAQRGEVLIDPEDKELFRRTFARVPIPAQ